MMRRARVVPASLALAAGIALAGLADDWPQWRGPQRDGVWRETGLMERLPGPQLPVKWRAPVGNGYNGPTVAGGRVFVMDRVTEPREQERIHSFDAATGRKLWSHAYAASYAGVGYPDGPRASVTLADGHAYSLGAVGHAHCLDAARGTVLWSRDLNSEYGIRLPTWGLAASPLVEGDLVIYHIGGNGGACVVALDRKTGRERWRALEDEATYSSPIVIRQAGKRVLVVWTAGRLVGLDPATGKLHWSHPIRPAQINSRIATPVVEGDRLFLTAFFEGSLLLEVPRDRLAVKQLWHRRGQNERNTDALQTTLTTPLMMDGYIYGIDSYGELRCLDARTGDRLWENLTAVPRARSAAAHLVRNGDRVWLFNERGELVLCRLSPQGYQEISRARLLKPTLGQLRERGGVTWSHPAFADRHVFARSDEELVCASLKAP